MGMVVGPDTKPERVPGRSMFITWEGTSLMEDGLLEVKIVIGKNHENDSGMYFKRSHFLASLAALYLPSLIQDLHCRGKGVQHSPQCMIRQEPSLVDIL